MVSHRRGDGGFTLVELLLALAIILVIGAVSVPLTGNAMTQFRLSGDSRGLSNTISVAKMRAAAHFTRVRLFADLSDNAYYVQTWDKTAGEWVANGGVIYLATDNAFGVAGATNAPANTQTTFGQAPECLDDDGTTPIGNSACIIFNSRGVPVDTTNTPTSNDALYVTNGETVYGATVSATGLIRLWRAQASGGTVTWTQ